MKCHNQDSLEQGAGLALLASPSYLVQYQIQPHQSTPTKIQGEAQAKQAEYFKHSDTDLVSVTS